MSDELYRKVIVGSADFVGEVCDGRDCTMHEEFERDEQAECKVAAWDRVREATGADYATNAVELRAVARRVHKFACNIQHEMGSTVAGILFAVAAALGQENV